MLHGLRNKGSYSSRHLCRDVAQLVKHRTGTLLTQVRIPGAARDFFPRVSFQCRLSYGVRTPPCARACINICAHVRDLVVHVRVWWIMETVKHPACTVRSVARLSQLAFPGKSNQNFPWWKSHWSVGVHRFPLGAYVACCRWHMHGLLDIVLPN